MLLTIELETRIEQAIYDGLSFAFTSGVRQQIASAITDEIVAILMDEEGVRFGV